MKYVLDTNILIHIVRNSATWQFVDVNIAPLDTPNQAYACFASVAEVFSMAVKLGWESAKMEKLAKLFSRIPVIGVSGNVSDKLLQSYVAIDAYSQGKHPDFALPKGLSARNMGKNDLWIAAAAHALNATLLTTDRDFTHLQSIFCEVCLIEPV